MRSVTALLKNLSRMDGITNVPGNSLLNSKYVTNSYSFNCFNNKKRGKNANIYTSRERTAAVASDICAVTLILSGILSFEPT